jgi:predicted ATPase
MVKEIKIQNYKSVQDLTLELGRINVLIGANGCGKSNILEAIAFGSAAADNKLSKEFLSARGIRVTDPIWMRSGFSKESQIETIDLNVLMSDEKFELKIRNDNKPFSEWDVIKNNDINREEYSTELLQKGDGFVEYDYEKLKKLLLGLKLDSTLEHSSFSDFLIYAIEESSIRRFEDDEKAKVLGIRGEGLFKLLFEMDQNQPEEFQEIIENLELIDWFEGFEIPKDLVFTERRIRIKDRFLEEGLQYFDQRSSNEGFLFLMFYFALFISKYTPKFFAIDNIDASLNPKLCIELIKILTKLAKKHDKQVIFTTHNPAILDGLNLNDDEVRLLVVSRNKDGHTKTKRITPTIVPEGEKPVRLSVQFMRGYIGGLPKNF